MAKLPRIHWRKFEKFLFAAGCTFEKEEGDHRKYSRPGLLRPVIIPWENSLPVFIVLNNLRVLGIPREEYLKILKKL